MAGHPTPLKTLKERKKKIDIYVKRLDDNKCKGIFVDMYRQIQQDFADAIAREENAKLKHSVLPISDVIKSLSLTGERLEILEKTYNRLLSEEPTKL